MASVVENELETESLLICFQLLESECSPTEFRSSLDLVVKICRNIQKNPSEEKYKQIKKENKSFKDKIWKFNGGQQLMLALGWTEVDETVMFLSESDLSSVITIVEDKLNTLPKTEVTTNNTTNNTATTASLPNGWTQQEMNKKEETLKKEREKRLAEIKRKKDEQKRVKAQIEADRDNIKARELKASKAVERKFGSNVKRFGDIGVDLNSGGG